MKVIFLLIGILFLISGCFLFKGERPADAANYNPLEKKFGSVFSIPFTKYNSTKVKAIESSIKSGKVKRLQLVYYKNEMLANMIRDEVSNNENTEIQMEKVDGSNEQMADYVGDKVIVSLYRNKSK